MLLVIVHPVFVLLPPWTPCGENREEWAERADARLPRIFQNPVAHTVYFLVWMPVLPCQIRELSSFCPGAAADVVDADADEAIV
jgi:hypothetical protein